MQLIRFNNSGIDSPGVEYRGSVFNSVEISHDIPNLVKQSVEPRPSAAV